MDKSHGDLFSAIVIYFPRILSPREEKRINRGLRSEEEPRVAEGPGSSSASHRVPLRGWLSPWPSHTAGTRLPGGPAEGALVTCHLP